MPTPGLVADAAEAGVTAQEAVTTDMRARLAGIDVRYWQTLPLEGVRFI